MNFYSYSPFEPTRLVYFQIFEDSMYIAQYITSGILCFSLISIYLILYINSFQIITIDSDIFKPLSIIYEFIYNITYDYLHKQLNYYFVFLLYIFLVIFTSNLIGMIPMSFAFTSHLTSTLSCALFIWLSVITIGLSKNGLRFFKVILPKGIPYVLVPFLILVEFISYIFRVISLSLRLFANVLAGHILLHVVSGFIFFILTSSISGAVALTTFTGFCFLLLLCILFFFELMVAMLQAYIFLVLSLIYIQDVYNINH